MMDALAALEQRTATLPPLRRRLVGLGPCPALGPHSEHRLQLG